jgi:hypothetical protein
MTFFGVVMAGVPFRGVSECPVALVGLQLSARKSESVQTSNSDGVKSGFPRPDPDGFFDRRYKDFAVADTPGLGGATDCLDGFLDHVVAEHDLDLHLGEKIDDVFGTPVKLGVAFLAPEPLGFGHGYSLQTDLLQRLLHFIEFERLDHSLDFFHRVSSPGPRVGGITEGTEPLVSRSRAKPAAPENSNPIKALLLDREPVTKSLQEPSPLK